VDMDAGGRSEGMEGREESGEDRWTEKQRPWKGQKRELQCEEAKERQREKTQRERRRKERKLCPRPSVLLCVLRLLRCSFPATLVLFRKRSVVWHGAAVVLMFLVDGRWAMMMPVLLCNHPLDHSWARPEKNETPSLHQSLAHVLFLPSTPYLPALPCPALPVNISIFTSSTSSRVGGYRRGSAKRFVENCMHQRKNEDANPLSVSAKG